VFENKPVPLHYPGMVRNLDKYDFDVVHSQTQFYLGILAYMVAKRKHIPHITTIHTLFTELTDDYPLAIGAGLVGYTIGFPFWFKSHPVMPFRDVNELRELPKSTWTDIVHKQGWRLMAEFVNHSSAFVSPSQHLAKTLIDNGVKVPCNIIPNGVFLDQYVTSDVNDSPIAKKSSERFIISVGRLSGEKRQFTLVNMMKTLKIRNTKLILVGIGPSEKSLKKRVHDLGLEDKVVFAGYQTPSMVAAMMKQANIFALSSYRFDNQPMVILEAIASGLPVVYCDNRLKEGLTSNNSVLTKGRSGTAFAKTVDELLANEALMASMSKASVVVSQNYDVMNLAKKMVELYETAPAMVK
jgi:glycosyltransferase involved in cell wall biosynthesis